MEDLGPPESAVGRPEQMSTIVCVRARACHRTTYTTPAASTPGPLGLRLHPERARCVNLTRGAEGIDFLGFHNHMCESKKRTGRCRQLRWPPDRAMAAIRARVRDRTVRRFVGSSLEIIVARLNHVREVGDLLPTRQLVEEVQRGQYLPERTNVHRCQQQVPALGA
jgi:hypothetical protein